MWQNMAARQARSKFCVWHSSCCRVVHLFFEAAFPRSSSVCAFLDFLLDGCNQSGSITSNTMIAMFVAGNIVCKH